MWEVNSSWYPGRIKVIISCTGSDSGLSARSSSSQQGLRLNPKDKNGKAKGSVSLNLKPDINAALHYN